jgi:hypothetical protein
MPGGSAGGRVLEGNAERRVPLAPEPHAGMYTQASTSKVAIMEWITIQMLSESWVMMRAPSKRGNLSGS